MQVSGALCGALSVSMGLVLWPGAEGRAAAEGPADDYLSGGLFDRIEAYTLAWGELGIDTAVRPTDGRAPQPLRIGDRTFTRGLGHHASGEIVVDLSGEFETFEADVGVQWQDGGTGTVVFRVLADGVEIYDSGTMTERDPARHVAVSVAGVDELELVVTDAGDGITCDCANWANARLVRGTQPSRAAAERFDAAPFGQVVKSDPARVAGTQASRVEEFPAADVYLTQEILPSRDGLYAVPQWPDGRGAIGLQWAERRFVREVGICLPREARTMAGKVRAQYWAGESLWQGQWQPLDGETVFEGPWLVTRAFWRGDPETRRRGTQKIRWVFDADALPAEVSGFRARTRSRWREVSLEFRAAPAGPNAGGRVEIHNGWAIAAAEPVRVVNWDMAQCLRVTVRATRPRSSRSDATVLRLTCPDGAFALAVDDVLEEGWAYVPAFGVLVADATRAPSLDAVRSQLSRVSSYLDQVRARPDQTFQQAMAHVHRDVQDHGPTMLSLACDDCKFVADEDGTLGRYREGQVHPSYEIRATPQFGSTAAKRQGRRLYRGWYPVPEITFADGPVTYTQRAFVAPFGAPPTDTRVGRHRSIGMAQVVLANESGASAPVRLALEFAADSEPRLALDRLADGDGVVALQGDRLVALFQRESGPELSVMTNGTRVVVSGELPARSSAEWTLALPGWTVGAGSRAFSGRAQERLADTMAYWDSVLGSAMAVELPDELLTNVIRASQVHCLMAARNEGDGARISPWISSDRYGPLESEANSIVLGMDQFGHHAFSRASLDYFIARYNPAGFLTTGYTLMGTGWHLWVLGEHHSLTGDDDWLRSHADDVARVCRWIVAQRAKTEGVDAHGERTPESGLVPPGVVADWGMYAYRFCMEAHYCAGLRDAARALTAIGHPDGPAFAAEAEAFRDDLVRAYRWAQARTPAMRVSDGTFTPGVPSMVHCFGKTGEFFAGEDWNRSWAGDVEIGPHHLAALGLMDPASRDVDGMVATLEDYWFLQDGMGAYPGEASRADWYHLGGFSKVQPYYTRVAEIHALRDDVKPFIRAYFNAIPSLLNCENLSFWEHFHNTGGWNKTHETGWFLTQTRTMLVTERGSELWLAPFVTSNWLRPGMSVSVRRAPTRFGPVSYVIRAAAENVIEATIDPPVRSAPEALVIRIRHPRGRQLKRVWINGTEHKGFDPAREWVRLTPSRERIHVRAEF